MKILSTKEREPASAGVAVDLDELLAGVPVELLVSPEAKLDLAAGELYSLPAVLDEHLAAREESLLWHRLDEIEAAAVATAREASEAWLVAFEAGDVDRAVELAGVVRSAELRAADARFRPEGAFELMGRAARRLGAGQESRRELVAGLAARALPRAQLAAMSSLPAPAGLDVATLVARVEPVRRALHTLRTATAAAEDPGSTERRRRDARELADETRELLDRLGVPLDFKLPPRADGSRLVGEDA